MTRDHTLLTFQGLEGLHLQVSGGLGAGGGLHLLPLLLEDEKVSSNI